MHKNPLESCPTIELDYNLLKFLLRSYKHPRVKINQLLRNQTIQRIKKGIYVRTGYPYNHCVLANMIYGPSYVSQDYALSLYGLIPERVTTITSITIGRSKTFDTPAGLFTYEPLKEDLYVLGIQRIEIDAHRSYLIATPEKALVDRIWKVKGLHSEAEMLQYLEFDMRFDFSERNAIRKSKMKELSKIYNHPTISLLDSVLEKRNKR